MFTKKITSGQAVSILLTAAKRVGIDKVMSEPEIKKAFASDLKLCGATLALIPLPQGVRIAQVKRGCVKTYTLTGPTQDVVSSVLDSIGA